MTSIERIASQEWLDEQVEAMQSSFPVLSLAVRERMTLEDFGSIHLQANIVLLLRTIIERLDES